MFYDVFSFPTGVYAPIPGFLFLLYMKGKMLKNNDIAVCNKSVTIDSLFKSNNVDKAKTRYCLVIL